MEITEHTPPIKEKILRWSRSFAVIGALIIVTLLLTGPLIFFSGVNPFHAYQNLLYGSFGTVAGFSNTMMRTVSLLFAGLGVAIAFKCSIWNIGADGQLYMGALGSQLVGFYVSGLPPLLHVSLSLVGGFILGGIWGFIPGYLRAKRNVNEIIATLMLNFIAYWIVYYLVHGPMRAQGSYNPVSEMIQPSAILPRLIPNTDLHVGILIGLALAVVVYILFKKTAFGFVLKASGMSPVAARFSGINVSTTIMMAMTLSGGLAGLAGSNEVLGFRYFLGDSISLNYGFIAIAVVLLARTNPLAVIPAAMFFGGLINGASYMQHSVGISRTLVTFTEGVIIVCISILPVLKLRLSDKNTRYGR